MSGGTSEKPLEVTEIHARSSGRGFSFLLTGYPGTPRDLSGYAAWVTFWYEGAREPHVVRAALVDESSGAVIYDLHGDELPREGIALAQATVMSPEGGFFEQSGEIIAIKVLPPVSEVRESPRSAPARASGLRPHDRVDLVMPEVCEIGFDISTGDSKVVSPPPGVAGAYTFFERSDPGKEWGDLFLSVATHLRLPWNTETFLAMVTVFSQKAWERVPPREQRQYIAGSILQQRRRSMILEETEERERRKREPSREGLKISHEHTSPIQDAIDPREEEAAEAEDWAERIERCRGVLSEVDDWSPEQEQLKAGLERQILAGHEVSPSDVGRAFGWSHQETMSTWQSLQRKARRAQRRHLSGGEEKVTE